MPVDTLRVPPEQRQRYGRYTDEPTEQLTRYGYLSQRDKDLIRHRRPEAYQQLGFALQLITVRFLGAFLNDPLDVPESVIAFGAEQLGLDSWSDLPRYAASSARDATKSRKSTRACSARTAPRATRPRPGRPRGWRGTSSPYITVSKEGWPAPPATPPRSVSAYASIVTARPRCRRSTPRKASLARPCFNVPPATRPGKKTRAAAMIEYAPQRKSRRPS